MLNLQLLVRSTAIESHLPSGTASHIPRPPFCFAEPLSSFKSRRGPTCTPGPTERVPGTDPEATARCHILQAAPRSLFLFCSSFFLSFGFNSGVPGRVGGGRECSGLRQPFWEREGRGKEVPGGDEASLGRYCRVRDRPDLSNKGAPRSEAEPEDNPALPSDEEGLRLSFLRREMTPSAPRLSPPHRRRAAGSPNEAQTCLPS